MKKILGIYNSNNYIYVKRQLYKLKEQNINVESMDVSTLTKKMPTPCFVMLKNKGVVDKLIGKYSDIEVYNWVRRYI